MLLSISVHCKRGQRDCEEDGLPFVDSEHPGQEDHHRSLSFCRTAFSPTIKFLPPSGNNIQHDSHQFTQSIGDCLNDNKFNDKNGIIEIPSIFVCVWNLAIATSSSRPPLQLSHDSFGPAIPLRLTNSGFSINSSGPSLNLVFLEQNIIDLMAPNTGTLVASKGLPLQPPNNPPAAFPKGNVGSNSSPISPTASSDTAYGALRIFKKDSPLHLYLANKAPNSITVENRNYSLHEVSLAQ